MSESTQLSPKEQLQQFCTLELAQALSERLAIAHQDWHRTLITTK